MHHAPATDPELWTRLAEWRRGEDAAALVAKLPERLSIYQKSAEGIVDALIRHAYLAAITPAPITAPGLVAEAYYLLAQDTAAYTDRFCAQVLRRDLPPEVTQGPPPDDPGHAAARALFQAEFGAPPPARIWHGPVQLWVLRLRMSALVVTLSALALSMLMVATGFDGLLIPALVVVGAGAMAVLIMAVLAPVDIGEWSNAPRSGWVSHRQDNG